MYKAKEINKPIQQVQRKLVQSLVINMIVPWALYMLIRRDFTSEAIPLAITASIPTLRTIVLWAWQRRIDWIGVFGVFGFAIASVASVLFGGSSLPLKLIHPILFGTIGLAFLISVLLKRPLMITIVRILKHSDMERFNSPIARKKFTIMSAVYGGISLVGSTIHVIMALTLPTSTFLATSHVVSWITVFALVVSGKMIVRRIK